MKQSVSSVASEDQFQLATYKKMPIAAERGEGVWIYTSNGERYLDLYGGDFRVTPRLAARASQLVVVERAYAQSVSSTVALRTPACFRSALSTVFWQWPQLIS